MIHPGKENPKGKETDEIKMIMVFNSDLLHINTINIKKIKLNQGLKGKPNAEQSHHHTN